MKYLLIYLLFVTSSFALSPTNCEHSPSSFSESYVLKENSVSCQKISYFQSTIEDIASYFTEAPYVRLFISTKSPNASFDFGETIRVPLQISFPGKYGSISYGDPSQTDYILAHEYGHAIFAKLLSRNEFYSKVYSLDKEVSRLEFDINIGSSLNEDVDQRLTELRERKDSYNKVRKLLSDYSEFFSDVVAVYYSENKDSMFNALYYPEMSDQSYRLVLARSFSDNYVDITDRIYSEDHASLVLVRQFVGEYLWPESTEDKAKFLKLIFNAIEMEVLDRLNREENRMSAKEMNESLIKRLKEMIKEDTSN